MNTADPPGHPAMSPAGRPRRSFSTRASPHVARSTTATFIPVGPARIGPRSPAVPNVSDPLNRAASSSDVQADSSATAAGSGSWAIHSSGVTLVILHALDQYPRRLPLAGTPKELLAVNGDGR